MTNWMLWLMEVTVINSGEEMRYLVIMFAVLTLSFSAGAAEPMCGHHKHKEAKEKPKKDAPKKAKEKEAKPPAPKKPKRKAPARKAQ